MPHQATIALLGCDAPSGVRARTAHLGDARVVADPVRVREIDDDEGRRLLRIIRRGTGSVVSWRRARMVLLSAQGVPVPRIAEVAFTSDDRVRDVLHNFKADGFASLSWQTQKATSSVSAETRGYDHVRTQESGSGRTRR